MHLPILPQEQWRVIRPGDVWAKLDGPVRVMVKYVDTDPDSEYQEHHGQKFEAQVLQLLVINGAQMAKVKYVEGIWRNTVETVLVDGLSESPTSSEGQYSYIRAYKGKVELQKGGPKRKKKKKKART